MSCNCTQTPTVKYQIPGSKGETGAAGTNGSDGTNAVTALTLAFTMPAIAGTDTADVGDSTWMVVGQPLFVETLGTLEVTAKPAATQVTLENLGYNGNAPAGTVAAPAALVAPGGWKGEDGTSATGDMLSSNNLSDLDNAATARTNLGLGTMAVETATDYLSKAGNLSGLANAATARTNLGVALGTNVQAYDAFLTSIALLGTAANKMIYTTAANTAAEADITAFGRSLLDDAAALNARETLGKVLPRYGLLASASAVDLNTAGDTALTVDASRYHIDKVTVENASVNLTTATVGVFTAAGGGGTTVAADQALAAITGSGKFLDLTPDAGLATNTFTAATLYARVGTPQGAAATANVFVFGWRYD